MAIVETYHQLHKELYNIQWKIKTFETILLEGMDLENTFGRLYPYYHRFYWKKQ